MNTMPEILEELRRVQGVKACMLVTSDGLVVAGAKSQRYRDDVLAGLASYLTMTTNKALAEAELPPFESFTLHAAHGKAVFSDIGEAFLVVLLDQFADLEASRRDIQGAAQRMRRLARIG